MYKCDYVPAWQHPGLGYLVTSLPSEHVGAQTWTENVSSSYTLKFNSHWKASVAVMYCHKQYNYQSFMQN